MRALLVFTIVALVVGTGAVLPVALSSGGSGKGEAQPVMPAERGRYLVHHVAMCVHCHTPHDEKGQLIQTELLRGAPMPVSSPFAGVQWAFRAPALAGLPGGWDEQETIHFLQTGQPPRGPAPRPPMPPYRMSEEDARAVAAYLKSLR